MIIRGRVPVAADDDAERLAAKVHAVEHRLYPLVVRGFAEGRLRMEGDRVFFDDRPLSEPLDLAAIDDEAEAG